MALTYDVLKPAKVNGLGIIYMVSGGWFSNWSDLQQGLNCYGDFLKAGYLVYLVRYCSARGFNLS